MKSSIIYAILTIFLALCAAGCSICLRPPPMHPYYAKQLANPSIYVPPKTADTEKLINSEKKIKVIVIKGDDTMAGKTVVIDATEEEANEIIVKILLGEELE